MDSNSTISIWLVVGISLLVNGLIILVAGIYEWVSPPATIAVQLFDLHAPVWWGGLLVLIGLVYCVRFSPFREVR